MHRKNTPILVLFLSVTLIHGCENELQKTKDQLKEAHSRISSLSSELNKTKQTLSSTEKELQKNNHENNQLINKLSKATNELNDLKKYKDLYDKLTKEHEILHNKHTIQEHTIKKLSDENTDLRENEVFVADYLTKRDKEVNRLQSEIQKLKSRQH